jgi:serine/threonine-protein kinase
VFEKVLGVGGQASVWLARIEATQERVAIKVGGDSSGNARQSREGRNLSLLTKKLAAHPNIVQFKKAAAEHNGVEVLVMEFVDGQNVRERLDNVSSLELDEAVWVMAGLLGGLSGLHEHGIAHRDIKPENLMIRSQHFEKLSDKVRTHDLETANPNPQTPTPKPRTPNSKPQHPKP